MEKIDLKELTRKRFDKCTRLESYLSIALCMLINDDDTGKAKEGKELELEVKINGREVKFGKFIKYLFESYERAVDEEAKNLAGKVLINIDNKVENMIEQFRIDLKLLKEEIFSEIKEKTQ